MAESMRAQRRWYESWWAMALWFVVASVAVRLLFGGMDEWLSAVIGGGLVGGAYAAFFRMRQRKDGTISGTETDDVPALDRRIRRGDIPDDPREREAMDRLVTRRLEQMSARRFYWAFGVLIAMDVAVGILAIVNGEALTGLLFIVGGTAFCGVLFLLRRRNIKRFEGVRQQLRGAHTEATATSGAAPASTEPSRAASGHFGD
ncbi:hypothetical protein [Streptomyces sp. NPDC060194]|uniref:hypothetical protein n=1 Tax=Streptomyces sp. NPDC060194 TaxID=3347069 RepID=UPI003652E0F5